MKKIFLAFLIVCLAGPLLFAGGNSAQNAPAPGKEPSGSIQWWSPNWDEVASKALVDSFQKEFPNIKVDLVITEWTTYKSKIITAASANNAPEITAVLISDVFPLTQVGLLYPLDDYVKQNNIDLSDYVTGALDASYVNGKLYSLPYRRDSPAMYYNADMLKAAGYDAPSAAWTDFIEMAKKVTKDGVYGIGWQLGDQTNSVTRLLGLLYTFGGAIFNDDQTKCLLDSDAAIKGLHIIVDSYKGGYASPNSIEWNNPKIRDAFGTGKIATFFAVSGEIANIQKSYPAINLKTSMVPGVNGYGVSTYNGWTNVMLKNSVNKDAAAKFICYIARPENQLALSATFPASSKALQAPKFSDPLYATFRQQVQNAKPESNYKGWAEVEPIIFSYMQKAVNGDLSVEDACKKMTADVNAVMQ